MLNNFRRKFNRFCFQNRNKGIPNLMMYIALGCALVNAMAAFTNNYILFNILCFNRELILRGEFWRLLTYPLTFTTGNLMLTAVALFCYYSLGRAMENVWGTFKFNLFYFTGVVMMDVYCMIFGGQASADYLNLSLFLSYATLYPNAQFLLMFIIPVKAWIFALVDLAIVLFGLVAYPFPYNLFSVISLANYFLFFGKDVLNVIPVSWRVNARRLFKKGSAPKKAKVVPFPNAGSYEATVAKPQAPYTHRCIICGRTDVSHPNLEFRYCSRCKGYHCYCEEHISNHAHIE